MTETPAFAETSFLPPLPPPSLSPPLFWPLALVAGTEKAKFDLALKNLEFVEEELKLHGGLKAKVASPNVVRLDLRTMVLRDYGKPGGIPTLVNAPFAGHRAMIADYHKGQSLVETLLAGGVGHVALTDWKSATEDMKDFEIDNYLEELAVGSATRTITPSLQALQRKEARWSRLPMASTRAVSTYLLSRAPTRLRT
jgi:hypothetical protein